MPQRDIAPARAPTHRYPLAERSSRRHLRLPGHTPALRRRRAPDRATSKPTCLSVLEEFLRFASKFGRHAQSLLFLGHSGDAFLGHVDARVAQLPAYPLAENAAADRLGDEGGHVVLMGQSLCYVVRQADSDLLGHTTEARGSYRVRQAPSHRGVAGSAYGFAAGSAAPQVPTTGGQEHEAEQDQHRQHDGDHGHQDAGEILGDAQHRSGDAGRTVALAPWTTRAITAPTRIGTQLGVFADASGTVRVDAPAVAPKARPPAVGRTTVPRTSLTWSTIGTLSATTSMTSSTDRISSTQPFCSQSHCGGSLIRSV